MNIVIVTACPSGIANSIIAAGLLEKASAELGWSAVVECHNQLSEPRVLTSAEIAAADLVVVAGRMSTWLASTASVCIRPL